MEISCQEASSAAAAGEMLSASSCSLQLSFNRVRDDRVVFHTCQLAISCPLAAATDTERKINSDHCTLQSCNFLIFSTETERQKTEEPKVVKTENRKTNL